MSDANDVTGYQGGSDASGKGGRAREKNIMSQVDAAANGPAHPAVTPSTPATSGEKSHPAKSSFAPSASTVNHSYGAPVSEPILSGGKD